jgi:hypothetical protein
MRLDLRQCSRLGDGAAQAGRLALSIWGRYATHNRSYQCRDVMLWLGVSLAASLRDATLALLHGGDLTSFSPPQPPARGLGLRNVLPSPVPKIVSELALT